ncbi:MAG: type II/IV secretion system ATPase subunit [Haloarculaceae archaeon]
MSDDSDEGGVASAEEVTDDTETEPTDDVGSDEPTDEPVDEDDGELTFDVDDGADDDLAAVAEDEPVDEIDMEGVERALADTDVGGSIPEDGETIDHPTRDEVLDDVTAYFDADGSERAFAEAPDEEFIERRWFDFSYLDRFEEVERQWVSEPYAYISILWDEEENVHYYRVTEPVLDEFEQYVRKDLIRHLRNSLMYQDLDDEDDRESTFTAKAQEIIADHAATVEDGSLHKIFYYLIRDFVYLGPIDPIMRDPAIEDISCDGVDIPIFVYHRKYRDLETNISFGREALSSFTVRLAQRAGKQISVSEPLIDGSLPDGSRVQLTFGSDISTRGSNFTIRKFADVPYTPIDLVNFGTFSVEQMAYFWLAIENNRSLIFAGGTGSGKTTSMNAVSFFIPPNSKVVSIEDTREITLPHDNWIQSVTRDSITAEGRGEISMYELLQAALRQRPEYILVGEIRTEQNVALTFFQAIGTGHTAYTTVHAESVEGVLNRLENPPLSVPTQMIQDLDIISIQKQTFKDGSRVRRNAEVTELLPPGQGTESVRASVVFNRDSEADRYNKVNDSSVLEEIAEARGWSTGDLARERQKRERVLEYLVENDISGYDEVTNVIHTFAKDPDTVMDLVEAGELDPSELEP